MNSKLKRLEPRDCLFHSKPSTGQQGSRIPRVPRATEAKYEEERKGVDRSSRTCSPFPRCHWTQRMHLCIVYNTINVGDVRYTDRTGAIVGHDPHYNKTRTTLALMLLFERTHAEFSNMIRFPLVPLRSSSPVDVTRLQVVRWRRQRRWEDQLCSFEWNGMVFDLHSDSVFQDEYSVLL